MRLQVVDKKKIESQLQDKSKVHLRDGSMHEFHGNGTNTTHVKHSIDFKLPTTGKIANMLSGSQADNKIREALDKQHRQ